VDKKDYYTTGESSGLRRAAMYDLLESVFICMPGVEFLEDLKTGCYDEDLGHWGTAGNSNLSRGIACLKSYLSSIQTRKPAEILEEIAVDRTALLRVTSDRNYRLPYESLYTPAGRAGDIISRLKGFYSRAGIVPEENIGEMLDYIGVEIDFMFQLCLKETGQWAERQDARPVMELEREFLEGHLGRWVNAFYTGAEPYCRTDFYRGFLQMLAGFMETELEYLKAAGV
jgi:putative dimethyl sulfoxide reductase chaperone